MNINQEITELKRQTDLLKLELRLAIDRWVISRGTNESFEMTVAAFDRWKLANWH